MAQIQVTDLTFSYDGNADDVLNNVTFNIDTDWKLGLIGRNGKGKTTLLNLFMGRYDYRVSIKTAARFITGIWKGIRGCSYPENWMLHRA